jgi:predicted RNase H-like HicB family nuclease
MRNAVVIEKADAILFGRVPDLLDCDVPGVTVIEVEKTLQNTIRFHLDGLRKDGVPQGRSH